MSKTKWKKAGKTVYGSGGSDTTYALEGHPEIRVESRKRPIPHANGEGSWMYTSYFVVRDDADIKECWRLAEAKEIAESIAMASIKK